MNKILQKLILFGIVADSGALYVQQADLLKENTASMIVSEYKSPRSIMSCLIDGLTDEEICTLLGHCR